MLFPIHEIFKKCCVAKNKAVFTREYLGEKWVKISSIGVVIFLLSTLDNL